MSRQHLNAYRTKLANIHAASGSLNEGPISQAFASLLEGWGRSQDLHFVQQWEGKGPRGNHIRVDGALVPQVLRIPFGYWEAKDSKDDLDREIAAKIAAGYPDDNIIYENSVTAVLRQNGKEVDRAPLQGDDDALLHLLNRFFAYEREEIAEFRRAAAQFRADLPQILEALRTAIEEAQARSSDFSKAMKEFLDHAREAINPTVSVDDVREMLIQHILTEEIFASVFDNAQYHRENNIAQRLGELESKFFTGALRHATTERLRPYYAAIKGAAADKLDRQLNRHLEGRREIPFETSHLIRCTYRAFNSTWMYFDKYLNSYMFRLQSLYPGGIENPTIAFDGMAASYPSCTLAVGGLFDKGLMKKGNGRAHGVARYRYNSLGEQLDNITDWALKQFRDRYGENNINKDDIFAYCYAALHDPVYRETFAADLRREFPRIPLHDDFKHWRDWGQQLLDLHIGYEKTKPFKFKRVDAPGKRTAVPKLRSLPDDGAVIVDSETQLSDIPSEAWTYRLGNRSAIDWVLDQHKEKTPRDPTVRAKFNTYRFADHKEEMIKLLARVITVSLETMKITDAMRALDRKDEKDAS